MLDDAILQSLADKLNAIRKQLEDVFHEYRLPWVRALRLINMQRMNGQMVSPEALLAEGWDLNQAVELSGKLNKAALALDDCQPMSRARACKILEGSHKLYALPTDRGVSGELVSEEGEGPPDAVTADMIRNWDEKREAAR